MYQNAGSLKSGLNNEYSEICDLNKNPSLVSAFTQTERVSLWTIDEHNSAML